MGRLAAEPGYKLYPGIRERDVHKTPDPAARRHRDVPRHRRGLPRVVAESVLRDLLGRPAPVWAILGATLLIVLVGVADDLWDLDWMIKLGAQFLAAGHHRVVGQLQIYSLPIGGLRSGRAG